MSNNLHFTEFFTSLRDPGPQRIMLFVAIQNPATFTIIQVETSNAVDERKAGASATIKSRKDEEAIARSSA